MCIELHAKGAFISSRAYDSYGDAGTINITGKDIQLTHNSSINTGVKSGEGQGGNVTINVATYVALENSDLTANAPHPTALPSKTASNPER